MMWQLVVDSLGRWLYLSPQAFYGVGVGKVGSPIVIEIVTRLLVCHPQASPLDVLVRFPPVCLYTSPTSATPLDNCLQCYSLFVGDKLDVGNGSCWINDPKDPYLSLGPRAGTRAMAIERFIDLNRATRTP